jgi:hypothetical protein
LERRCNLPHWDGPPRSRANDMLDSILIAAGVGFFVLAVLYVYACDRM